MTRLFLLVCAVLLSPAISFAQAPGPTRAADTQAENFRREELRRIEARLEELRAERARHPIAMPIVLTAAGFGIGGGLALASGLELMILDSEYGHDKTAQQKRQLRTMGACSVVAVAAGFGGAVWLSFRLRPRRALVPEKTRLLEYRRTLELSLGVQGSGLALTGRF